jgi:hypothetical protein
MYIEESKFNPFTQQEEERFIIYPFLDAPPRSDTLDDMRAIVVKGVKGEQPIRLAFSSELSLKDAAQLIRGLTAAIEIANRMGQ